MTEDGARYDWHPSSGDGSQRRHMHQIELLNALGAQSDSCWSMYTGVTLALEHQTGTREGEDPWAAFQSALRQAWTQLRFEAPIHATTTERADIDGLEHYEFVYAPPRTAAQVQEWLDATVHFPGSEQGWTREKALEYCIADRKRLEVGNGHCTGNLYAFRGDRSGQSAGKAHLFFATPHCATDVRGSLSTLHRLLDCIAHPPAVAHPQWGEEIQRLYPPAIHALGLRSDGDEPPIPLADYQARLAAPKAGLSPSCALPIRGTPADVAEDQSPVIFAQALFPPEKHDAITRAGKANGTSVTGIVAGVLALLSLKYNVTPDAKSAAIWGAAVDRRAGLPERYRPFYQQCIWSKTILLGNMAAIRKACDAFEQRGEIVEEYWEVCRDFKADLDAFAKDELNLAMSHELATSGRGKVGASSAFEAVAPAQCFYSSYGKLDNVLQHAYGYQEPDAAWRIEVDAPATMSLCHNVPLVSFSSSSWKGSLKIFAQYSRTHHRQEDIDAFFRDIRHLCEAIAVAAE